MDLDFVLKELGQFGKYQTKVFVLLMFPLLHHTICSLSYIFTASDPGKYRCLIPECEGTDTPFQTPWLHIAIPIKENDKINYCERFKFIGQRSFDNCTDQMFLKNETEVCSRHVFQTSENTIMKEFNLLCPENEWKRTAVGTLNNLAQFIGLPIAGYFSDRYGRKYVTIIGVLLSSILGALRSFSSSYTEFIIYEMLDAMASAGIYCSTFILGIEIIGPDMRGFCSVLFGTYYPIGEMLLGLVVWLVEEWRYYLRILYLPGLVFIIYIWLLPESFRWEISHGKHKKGVKRLIELAETNGKPITDEVQKVIDAIENNKVICSDEGSTKYPIKKAFSSRIILLRVINCCYSWVTHTFVFYGLSLNAVSIAGNKYLNFILVSFIEIPAYFIAWWAIDSLGRRMTIFIALLLSGLSCTAFYFVSSDAEILRLLLFMTGKFAITISFTVLYIMTSEFFPTEMRNTLIGFCSTIGRLGSMIAPQTPLLEPYISPVLVFGLSSFVAAALGLYFPETRNIKMPDTLEEAETIGKDKKKVNITNEQ